MMNRRNFLTTAAATLASTSWAQVEKTTSASTKIRVGQIGVCHAHAAERMRSLRRLNEYFEVVGIVDDRAYSNEARNAGDNLDAYKGVPWMTEDELFKVPNLQAVLVETTNLQLVPTAQRIVEKGFSISMDKPGGNDLKAYESLLTLVKEKSVDYQIAYMFRNNLAIQWIKQAVTKGLIGDVFEIRASMSHNYGGKKYQEYLREYQGGIMFLLGCHHIDWVVDLFGEPEEVIPFLSQTKGALASAKNHCLSVLRYSHTLVSIHACDSDVGGIPTRSIKICGTLGTIELSPIERFDGKPLDLNLTLLNDHQGYKKGNQVITFEAKTDRYADQLIEFAKVLGGEIKSPHSLEHELKVQRVLHQACGLAV